MVFSAEGEKAISGGDADVLAGVHVQWLGPLLQYVADHLRLLLNQEELVPPRQF